ncbi:MAG: METTL5 family protein [Haloquadratum sp.]|nr:METTL5 family protein [Haloferacaceae archaeon]MDR9444818.1 METTL5 family protein [Haloquadratum sp.]
MPPQSTLETQLAVVAGFDSPDVHLEQYRTPPEIAAAVIHRADLEGDIADRQVADLGCGTGMLALGAALRGASTVVGVDIDPAPLTTAMANARKVGARTAVGWVCADAHTVPLAEVDTVVMNPPFGAQRTERHADRGFLETAATLAEVSYSIHNAGSRAFVEAFVDDAGGTVEAAFGAALTVPATYAFHTADAATIDAEVYRISWAG